MEPEGMYKATGVGMPWSIDVYYSNLTHDPISLNMNKFAMQFTHMAVNSAQVVYMHLPLINKWAYQFDYVYRFAKMDFSGNMKIVAADTFAKTTTNWKATDKGYFYPSIIDLEVDFGTSHLEVESSRFMKFFYT